MGIFQGRAERARGSRSGRIRGGDPRKSKPYRFAESLPPAVLKALNEMHTEYLSSRSLLGDFDGSAEMHLLHGQDHISEFTHALIGVELGRQIVQGLQTAAR